MIYICNKNVTLYNIEYYTCYVVNDSSRNKQLLQDRQQIFGAISLQVWYIYKGHVLTYQSHSRSTPFPLQ
jgi:hypothetical protein